MRRLVPALLMVFSLPALAADGDVPLPQKKPRDAKGQPITSGKPESSKPGAKSAATAAGKTSAETAPAVPPAKSGDAAPAPAISGSGAGWPKTLPEAKAEADAKAKPETVPTTWTEAEIVDAKAMCKTILSKIDAVTMPEEPFRKGDCGAPAPVRLISIGRKPEVVLNPPALVTCGMAGALHTWLTKDLQPLAKQHLGSEIIKIETMSDYSCRNAYGRTKTKLSEHGRANALDIRGFVTAKGESAVVLTGWGDTERDIAARALAAKQAEEKADAIRAAAEAAAKAQGGGGPGSQTVAGTGKKSPSATGSVGAPKVRDSIVEGAPTGGSSSPALGVAPSQLGGPKEERGADPPGRVRTFLRQAHGAACRIFGTTLGPEANNAHRNHFHVDMAPRERSKFCE